MLIRLLLCSLFASPLFATFGISVITDDFVIVAIDSQISGARRRVECKMEHNDHAAIISSGTYQFYPRVDPTMFEVTEAEINVLNKWNGSVKELSNRFDTTIRFRYREALANYFFKSPFEYWGRYWSDPVAEFIVAGVDKDGPWLGNFVYFARTPAGFHVINPPPYTKLPVHQFRMATVPKVSLTGIVPADYWQIKLAVGEKLETVLVEKVRYLLEEVAKREHDAVNPPFAIAVINKQGFRFINSGSCTPEVDLQSKQQ